MASLSTLCRFEQMSSLVEVAVLKLLAKALRGEWPGVEVAL